MRGSRRRRPTFWADVGLLAVAAIWGSAFVAQRLGMASTGPLAFNAARFALGGAVLLGVNGVRRARGKLAPPSRGLVRDGALLGVLLFGGSAFQQVGLVETEAGKAGFITGLYVVLVPLLTALVWRERVAWHHRLGAGVAVVGLFLLSVQGSFRPAPGDLWVLGGAVMWAVHVIAVGRLAQGRDPVRLAMVQYGVCALLSGMAAPAVEGVAWPGLRAAMPAVLYAGVLSTAVAYTGQVIAQRHTTATHAAIILSGESLFAALFGRLFLHEGMTGQQWVGGGLMLVGMVLAQLAF